MNKSIFLAIIISIAILAVILFATIVALLISRRSLKNQIKINLVDGLNPHQCTMVYEGMLCTLVGRGTTRNQCKLFLKKTEGGDKEKPFISIKEYLEQKKDEFELLELAYKGGVKAVIQEAFNLHNIALLYKILDLSQYKAPIPANWKKDYVKNWIIESNVLYEKEPIINIAQYKIDHEPEFKLVKWLWDKGKKISLEEACELNNSALLRYVIELSKDSAITKKEIDAAATWCSTHVEEGKNRGRERDKNLGEMIDSLKKGLGNNSSCKVTETVIENIHKQHTVIS